MYRRPLTDSNYLHRAVNNVALPWQRLTGRARWNLIAPTRRTTCDGEYYISVGHTQKPYGRSTHTSAYLTHIVVGVLVVWRRGIYFGSAVKWRCGAVSLKFNLIDEPNSVICPACKIERLPRER